MYTYESKDDFRALTTLDEYRSSHSKDLKVRSRPTPIEGRGKSIVEKLKLFESFFRLDVGDVDARWLAGGLVRLCSGSFLPAT